MSEGVNVETLEKMVQKNTDMEVRSVQKSEVEKLMKKTSAQNNEKADFPIGATIGFLAVGALCSLGTDNFWGTFGLISAIILFFAFVSSNMKPTNENQFRQYGEAKSSANTISEDWSTDSMYSGVHGNVYTHD